MPKKTQLNESQKKAVNHKKGPLLVVAGAGTGKTRVITERIKYLIQKRDIGPKEILSLTFTDKAAAEMLERTGDIMPLGYEEPWVSTFHRFADRILKKEGLEIGIDPGYKILSYSEQWLLLRKNIFKLKLNYFRPLGNPTKFVSAILKFISRLQDENISTIEFSKYVKDLKYTPEEKTRWKELSYMYAKYQELKIQNSKIDFGDLITWVIELFIKRPNVLKKYQDQFKHVLVDEFQDTNYAQYELIKLLCPKKMGERSLLVVGDDSQSIYKFRGAAVSNILQFMEDYPKAKMITLIENFRSTQQILDPAYKLIKNNNPDTLESKLGISKELKSETKQKGFPPTIFKTKTLEGEVSQVIRKMYELLGKEPALTYKDFAILARANRHLDPFVLGMKNNKIPYQLVGNRGLYDKEEIRDILALLRVLVNIKDSISLYRTLNIDPLNIPYAEITNLLSKSRYERKDLWDCIKKSGQENVKELCQTIVGFQEKITKLSPKNFIYELVNEINYLEQYLKEETIENEMCIKNLNLFLQRADKFQADYYDENKEIPTIIDFVDYLDQMIEAGENPAQAEIEDIDTVNLMTVHSAKGLEFQVVFLVNTTSDRFPTRNRKDIIQIPDEIIKETLPTGNEHIQEERRLFYVAMTRAKKYLFMVFGEDYGGKRKKIPSGFLNETGLKTEKVSETKKKDQESLFGTKTGFRDISKEKPKPYVPYSLSYSKIESYNTCPLQYRYAYILNVPQPPNPALAFGITIHNTLHRYHLKKQFGENPSLNDLLKIYENCWNPLGFSDENHRSIRYESGKSLLKKYYEKHHKESVNHEKLEEMFTIRINGIKFSGKIDRIDKLPSGKFELIDYKTGSVKTQKDVDKDAQVSFYSLGAKEALGIDVDKFSYYFLETGDKISTTRTKKQVEEKKEVVLDIANEMRGGIFDPKSGMHCKWCGYYRICPFAYKD